MSFFNRRFSSGYRSGDLNLVGYKISFEPMEEVDPEMSNLLLKLFKEAQRGKRGVIERLRKYIAKYPKEPALKNYLFVAYKKKGKEDEAHKVLQMTIDQHPDYLFGKLNLAGEYITKKQYEKVPELLGETLEIKALYPDRDTFHVTEAMAFLNIVTIYFIETRDWDAAEMRLEIMRKIDPDDARTEQLGLKLDMAVMSTGLERMQKNKEKDIEVDSFPTKIYDPTTEPPELTHEPLRAFYQNAVNKEFPTSLISEIVQLPSQTLIPDLEKIVEDTVRRYGWFRENYEEFDDRSQEFQIHAMYFLAALKANDSLEVILNLLRQGEEILDYWFSDQLIEIFLEPLYILGESQLDQMKSFVLENNIYSYARLAVTKAVVQIPFHQPNRLEEVLQWFKEVLQYHLDHPDNENIIDTNFIGWAVVDLSDLQTQELDPLITALWKKDWIREDFMGDLNDILETLHEPMHGYDRMPMPEDIYEFYDLSYLQRKKERVYTPEEKAEMEKLFQRSKNSTLIQQISRIIRGENKELNHNDDFYDDYEELPNTPKHQKSINPKKVGRNEPCLCGSGKKYKKCCLNK